MAPGVTEAELLGQAASLEKAKAAGKEILVVCIGKTRRGEIERELESCRLQKIRVAGVVVVE